MNYKIALIALIVLVLIGTASALLVTFSKAQSNETDDSGIIKMIPMEIKNGTANFIPWFGKAADSKASFIPMEIKNKEAGDEEIIFSDIFLGKQQLPALFHDIVYVAK